MVVTKLLGVTKGKLDYAISALPESLVHEVRATVNALVAEKEKMSSHST